MHYMINLSTLISRATLAMLGALAISGCTLSMEYNRAMEIKAINASYSAGQITKKQRDKQVAAVQKKYAEYEAQWIAQMNGGGGQSQGYSYTPQPQMVYVYNQNPGPRETYIPPQQQYVYNQNPGPRETYVPPQQQYVYNQQPAAPQQAYVPPPQQTYVYNQPAARPQQDYTPPPQQKYVYNNRPPPGGGEYTPSAPPTYITRDQMTPAQRKEFDAQALKPGTIQADPHQAFTDNLKKEDQNWTNALGKNGPAIRDGIGEAVLGSELTPGGKVVKVLEPKGIPEPKSGVMGWFSKIFEKKAEKDVDDLVKNASTSTSTKKK